MCRWIFIVAFFIFPSLGFGQSDLHVPVPYPTIQDAINAAVPGDTVIVAPGIYPENINFIGKAITVISSCGAKNTIIKGDGSTCVVLFNSGEVNDSVLDGFTITNGSGYQFPSTGKCGGGVCIDQSSPVIKNNIIKGNYVNLDGAGIWIGFNDSSLPPTYILNNVIHDNECTSGGTASCGGGIMCTESDALVYIINNLIYHNKCDHSGSWSGHGGGIDCWASNVTIINNTICANEVNEFGGGICIVDSTVDIYNSIIRDNLGTTDGYELAIFDKNGTSHVSIDYSNLKGGFTSPYFYRSSSGSYNPGSNMMISDPLFVDAANHDYHLSYYSPCKEAGDDLVVTEAHDFEGDPRIVGGAVGMGADEFYTHLYYVGDAVPGGSLTVKMTDAPGSLPIILFLGSGVYPAPLPTVCGDWFLVPPVFPYFFGSIPAGGVFDSLSTTFDPAMVSATYRIQALIDDWLTNTCVIVVQ